MTVSNHSEGFAVGSIKCVAGEIRNIHVAAGVTLINANEEFEGTSVEPSNLSFLIVELDVVALKGEGYDRNKPSPAGPCPGRRGVHHGRMQMLRVQKT